jgi:hypothetical protein
VGDDHQDPYATHPVPCEEIKRGAICGVMFTFYIICVKITLKYDDIFNVLDTCFAIP